MNIYTIPQTSLKYVRTKIFHMTLATVAKYSGVSQSTISRIERGFTNVGQKYIMAVRKFYARCGIAVQKYFKNRENKKHAQ